MSPIFIENSKLPVWLSSIGPINIGAITLFPFVISRGRITKRTRVHETIHFQQALETFVVGFYVFYLLNYGWLLLRGYKGNDAYRGLQAEKEAYANERNNSYLDSRRRWRWLWE